MCPAPPGPGEDAENCACFSRVYTLYIHTHTTCLHTETRNLQTVQSESPTAWLPSRASVSQEVPGGGFPTFRDCLCTEADSLQHLPTGRPCPPSPPQSSAPWDPAAAGLWHLHAHHSPSPGTHFPACGTQLPVAGLPLHVAPDGCRRAGWVVNSPVGCLGVRLQPGPGSGQLCCPRHRPHQDPPAWRLLGTRCPPRLLGPLSLPWRQPFSVPWLLVTGLV